MMKPTSYGTVDGTDDERRAFVPRVVAPPRIRPSSSWTTKKRVAVGASIAFIGAAATCGYVAFNAQSTSVKIDDKPAMSMEATAVAQSLVASVSMDEDVTFDALDVDHDGVVTSDEYINQMELRKNVELTKLNKSNLPKDVKESVEQIILDNFDSQSTCVKDIFARSGGDRADRDAFNFVSPLIKSICATGKHHDIEGDNDEASATAPAVSSDNDDTFEPSNGGGSTPEVVTAPPIDDALPGEVKKPIIHQNSDDNTPQPTDESDDNSGDDESKSPSVTEVTTGGNDTPEPSSAVSDSSGSDDVPEPTTGSSPDTVSPTDEPADTSSPDTQGPTEPPTLDPSLPTDGPAAAYDPIDPTVETDAGPTTAQDSSNDGGATATTDEPTEPPTLDPSLPTDGPAPPYDPIDPTVETDAGPAIAPDSSSEGEQPSDSPIDNPSVPTTEPASNDEPTTTPTEDSPSVTSTGSQGAGTPTDTPSPDFDIDGNVVDTSSPTPAVSSTDDIDETPFPTPSVSGGVDDIDEPPFPTSPIGGDDIDETSAPTPPVVDDGGETDVAPSTTSPASGGNEETPSPTTASDAGGDDNNGTPAPTTASDTGGDFDFDTPAPTTASDAGGDVDNDTPAPTTASDAGGDDNNDTPAPTTASNTSVDDDSDIPAPTTTASNEGSKDNNEAPAPTVGSDAGSGDDNDKPIPTTASDGTTLPPASPSGSGSDENDDTPSPASTSGGGETNDLVPSSTTASGSGSDEDEATPSPADKTPSATESSGESSNDHATPVVTIANDTTSSPSTVEDHEIKEVANAFKLPGDSTGSSDIASEPVVIQKFLDELEPGENSTDTSANKHPKSAERVAFENALTQQFSSELEHHSQELAYAGLELKKSAFMLELVNQCIAHAGSRFELDQTFTKEKAVAWIKNECLAFTSLIAHHDH